MEDIKKVVIVGAGTMGHSLALLFAKGGFKVSLVDKDPAALQKALHLIDSARKTLLQEKVITVEEEERVRTFIAVTSDMREAAKGSDFALETVDEDPEIK